MFRLNLLGTSFINLLSFPSRMSVMDSRIVELLDLTKLPADEVTWAEVLSKVFDRSLSFDRLWEIHSKRDVCIDKLLDTARDRDVVNLDAETGDLSRFFEETTSGTLKTNTALYVGENGLHIPEYGVTIAKNTRVCLGFQVELVSADIRAPLYLSLGARLFRTNVISGNATRGSVYMGPYATVEGCDQLKSSVIGSKMEGFRNGRQHTYYHGNAANNLIVGGSTGVSDGVTCQSHFTEPRITVLVDPTNPFSATLFTNDEARNISTIVGCDVSVGDGTHLTNPSTIGAGSVVSSRDGGRLLIRGLIKNGQIYFARADGSVLMFSDHTADVALGS